jgi:uncharacterized protein
MLGLTLAALFLLTDKAAMSHTTEEIIRIDTGAGALEGTLSLPERGRDLTGVLLLAGSGPTDRDGNQHASGLMPNTLRMLSEGLVSLGFAVLRTDKRGVAASALAAPAEAALRFGSYVDDAVAWLDALRGQPRIERLVLVGHSEGALVATLAAQRRHVDGLVLIAGAGYPAGQTLREQLQSQELPESLLQSAEGVLAALEAGELVADPPAELAALFRPSVQPYLSSWLGLQPAAELARVASPVLLVQGGTDLQVGVAHHQRLRAARPDACSLFLPGMNHVLKEAPAARHVNLQTYADPGLPLADGLVPGIATFIRRPADDQQKEGHCPSQ